MNWKIAAIAVGCCLPLLAAAPRQNVQVTTTDRVPFAPGGLIHLSGLAGQLAVEGWDEPAVEITVTRTLFVEDSPKPLADARDRLAGIGVSIEGRDTNKLVISTKSPGNYRIRMPRESNLLIQQNGEVMIYGMNGDIDASAHGGIFIQIPETSPYSIDARSLVGGIYSDFPGQHHKSSLLGEKFGAEAAASAHRLRLRAAVGGIDIQKSGGFFHTTIAADVRGDRADSVQFSGSL